MGRLNAKNIDDTILNNFKSMVVIKHGKLRNAYSIELEKALSAYMLDMKRVKENTHAQKSVKKENNEEKDTKPSSNQESLAKSSYYAKLSMIQDNMKKMGAWEEFKKPIAAKFIKEIVGGDPRTIEKWTSDLLTNWGHGL
jgi:hypothetical protein